VPATLLEAKSASEARHLERLALAATPPAEVELDRIPERLGEIERLRAFRGAAEIELEWHPRSRGRDWSPR